jgi:ABC-type Fe3+/spermidine/putrescine transport system ATPase subunit
MRIVALVIVGPSGSGKTTLLRIVAGLETPEEGEVWLEDRRASAPRQIVVQPYERSLGFVFQDLALWPHMTIGQHLDFVLKASGVPTAARQARARDALARARIAQMGRSVSAPALRRRAAASRTRASDRDPHRLRLHVDSCVRRSS